MGIMKVQAELENLFARTKQSPLKKWMDQISLREKIQRIPNLGERLEQLKDLTRDFLAIDLDKEKLFTDEFKQLATHCLLIETNNKLVLIETGVGLNQVQSKNHDLRMRVSSFLSGLELSPENTAYEQIKKLGFSPNDVSDIIIGHCDMDHIGGLSDFPQATAHMMKTEWDHANHPESSIEIKRYLKNLWENHSHFEFYENIGEKFHHFNLTRIKGLNELYLISLAGHTHGQAGVYIPSENFVFASDAYMNQMQMDPNSYQPLAIKAYTQITTMDEAAYQNSLTGLRHLCQNGVHVCCSHDRRTFEHWKAYWQKKNSEVQT